VLRLRFALLRFAHLPSPPPHPQGDPMTVFIIAIIGIAIFLAAIALALRGDR
jgi:hypothetical protein